MYLPAPKGPRHATSPVRARKLVEIIQTLYVQNSQIILPGSAQLKRLLDSIGKVPTSPYDNPQESSLTKSLIQGLAISNSVIPRFAILPQDPIVLVHKFRCTFTTTLHQRQKKNGRKSRTKTVLQTRCNRTELTSFPQPTSQCFIAVPKGPADDNSP